MSNGTETRNNRNDGRSVDDDKPPPKKTNYYKDFSANTSLHGVKYTAEDERSPLEKIFWIVMVLLSFAICVFLVGQVWHKWKTTPVIVSFSETLTPLWKIPMPVLTVCPSSVIDAEKFNYAEVCARNGDFKDEEEEELFSFVSKFCDRPCDTKRALKNTAGKKSLEVFKNISTTLESALIFCRIFGKDIDCSKFFTPILTDGGVCFSANMFNAKDIYNEEVPRDDYYLNSPLVNDGWSLDDWYSDEAPFQTYPVRAQGAGQTSGLVVSLRNKHSQHVGKCSGVLNGFKFLIHPSYVVPVLREDYAVAEYDSYVTVRVRPEAMTTSEGLKNYAPDKRQCYFSNEKKLKYFKNYTRENCEFECLANYTLAVCGCATAAMPRDESTPVCSQGASECVIDAIGELTIMQDDHTIPSGAIDDRDETKRDALVEATRCDCRQACTSIRYQRTIEKGKLDSEQAFGNELNGSQSTVLTVFMDNPHFMMSKRSELYGIIDFLANCGGLIGVCMGFSILSLVEIVYFFIIRFFCNMRKHNTELKANNEDRLNQENSLL